MDTAARTDSSPDERRLVLELEFVQCLANPKYLQFLAQHQYFADPAFINYLKYLLYWREPQYAKLIVYPYCLEMLDLLQHESFRASVALESTVQLIHQKEYYHWQHWRTSERRVLFGHLRERFGAGDARLMSVEEVKAHLRASESSI
ncbi:Mediator of RNA polymerase II transcription subunit 31 [Entophlyctis luteolus]|nr:Mediator of RNA polymerase II transcription subunit 31 [Entophlyctis luteolus]KAJ3346007.1 Mediator of RNA polymerase II transcription subunit 31 [Entophlyctis luteolus]KAJ3384774.1 Mediator of RNA polymerase II transcription subunit 31 [Entophlyctis sp. JEL0112]